MTNSELRQYLAEHDVRAFGSTEWPGDRDLAQAWRDCCSADWMIRLAGAASIDARTLRLLAADIAEDVLLVYERAYPGDDRPRVAIETARRYARGEGTEDELAQAAAAVWHESGITTFGYPISAARFAALAAAWAAAQAAAQIPAHSTAQWAAEAVADNARLYAAAKARHADMVRAAIPVEMIEAAMKGGAS